MKKIIRSWVVAIGFVLACPTVAMAATAQTTMLNTATVLSTCIVLAVGFTTNYDPTSSTATQPTATITTTCTSGASATITLDQGLNANTGSTDAAPLRRLKQIISSTSYYLNYGLYQNNARTTVWGNTSGTGLVVSGTGIGVITTVYANLPTLQAVPAGAFTDTVTVTLTY